MTRQSTNIINKEIKNELKQWNKETDVAEYLKGKLSQEDKEGMSHIETLVDNIILKAKLEDEPKWTRLIFDNIKEDNKKESTTQINIFTDIAQKTNETIDKLVDVTPKKKKKTIYDLI